MVPTPEPMAVLGQSEGDVNDFDEKHDASGKDFGKVKRVREGLEISKRVGIHSALPKTQLESEKLKSCENKRFIDHDEALLSDKN